MPHAVHPARIELKTLEKCVSSSYVETMSALRGDRFVIRSKETNQYVGSLPALEQQARGNLNLTWPRTFRGLNIRDCSKWRRVEDRIRRRVIHVVQDIRRLSSDLKAHGLLDPHRLR